MKNNRAMDPKLKKLPSGEFCLWRGKGRRLKKFSRGNWNLYQWALNLKPGDYFASCDGCNRKVASIEISWSNYGRWQDKGYTKQWFINDIKIIDSRGSWHFCPGGGCASYKETPEQVRDWNRRYIEDTLNALSQDESPHSSDEIQGLSKKMEKINFGHPIVDEFGEYLPDWKDV